MDQYKSGQEQPTNYLYTWSRAINKLPIYLVKSNQQITYIPGQEQPINYLYTWSAFKEA